MIKINRLRTEIITDRSENVRDLYGFEFEFELGLNVVAGQNSRGKTTINSCIYYALGLEELLTGHNEKALDKALKESFTINTGDDSDAENYIVKSSKTILEIENSQGEIVCLERFIKSQTDNIQTSNIMVYSSDYSGYADPDVAVGKDIYFVKARGNNDDVNGFYNWLSNFIGIDIPEVSNSSRKSNYSPLYLQTVFSALFIEQTKGWSDFLATMPFFGIAKPKEKIFEFLIDLNEIDLSTKRDVLNKKKSQIVADWKSKMKSFTYLKQQYGFSMLNMPEAITTDTALIDNISFLFSKSEDEKITLNQLITEKETLLKKAENKPFTKIKDNREKTLADYEENKTKYLEQKKYLDDFETKLSIDRQQLLDLKKQFNSVNQEIVEHTNLLKVFDENLINERGGNLCPTCTQEVSANLISTNKIKIPQLTLEENKGFLKSQKKIIEASVSSLNETIDEREVLLSFLKSSLRNIENTLKSLSKDLIADDRAFSESEMMKKLELERDIEDLNILNQDISDIKSDLENLSNKYHNNEIERGNLGSSEDEDQNKINDFEKEYKRLLDSFKYDSNPLYKIHINKVEPFKYYPVYKNHFEDQTPQSVRTNSSASDFVRNIWAYTIALLKNSPNHPGIIMFDEPGQHRTNITSLKGLFKECSTIPDKQTIIFTSIDKPINEDEKIDLDQLIENLNDGSYKLHRLNDENKVINKL